MTNLLTTLNADELEAVAGGFPFLAMPAMIAVLSRPQPQPSDEPVPTQAAE